MEENGVALAVGIDADVEFLALFVGNKRFYDKMLQEACRVSNLKKRKEKFTFVLFVVLPENKDTGGHTVANGY